MIRATKTHEQRSKRKEMAAATKWKSFIATIDVTQNVYNKTWWEERVEAVSMAAATVWREFMPTQKALAPM
jgi:hypothetical protein